jgi:hypothetical protein
VSVTREIPAGGSGVVELEAAADPFGLWSELEVSLEVRVESSVQTIAESSRLMVNAPFDGWPRVARVRRSGDGWIVPVSAGYLESIQDAFIISDRGGASGLPIELTEAGLFLPAFQESVDGLELGLRFGASPSMRWTGRITVCE